MSENQDNKKDAENAASEETAEQQEVPDLSQYPITRRGDDITIGTGNATHVVDITVSEEEYEAIKQAIPEEPAYNPASPPYHMGDTVYLDNQEYRITELRDNTVQLLPNGVAYPVFRAERRERFEGLLRQDSRNGAVTEYLAPNPSNVDQDLLEVLASGLPSAQDKEYISGWLRDGEGNTRIAQRLSELFANRAETMELATGDTADFRTYTTGIEVEILDSEERRLAALGGSWSDMAPILRGLYIHEQEGFYQNPENYRQKQTVLEGQPSYQVGDSVFLPAPDQPISGTLGYVGDTTVRIDTGPYSWSNKVMGLSQFEELLRQDERNARLFVQEEKESDTPELPELTTEPETIYSAEQNELPYDIVVERLRVNEAERPEPETVAANFCITDEHLGEGGPKQKFRANIMAIQLLKKCEEENRPATPDEQKILSGYVGWGGLADAFDE
ncbi:MAG TPA: helicase, partial [Candidatus Pullilachnospira stercoravium]|nr:helicase [Candidatus Pullilachnospira stercoravium]